MNESVCRKGARILIVDDQEKNVSVLAHLLQKAGYATCITMTDPTGVIAKLPLMQPDLVLLDLHMEPISGLYILREISRIFAPDLRPPVIVLTADTDPEIKREALAAGASDFLSKPLDYVELLLRINRLLDSRMLKQSSQQHSAELEFMVDDQTLALKGEN
jgi:DNA-binding response OmpR family regulator